MTDQWSDHAACLGVSPAEFFERSGGKNPKWQQLCSSCPVRAECLDAAMTAEQGARYRYGIYGGLTPDQRTRLAQLDEGKTWGRHIA